MVIGSSLLSGKDTPGESATMEVSKAITNRVGGLYNCGHRLIIDPASWTTYQVDHFSRAGAEAIIAVNDEFFRPQLESLWRQSG